MAANGSEILLVVKRVVFLCCRIESSVTESIMHAPVTYTVVSRDRGVSVLDDQPGDVSAVVINP